MLLHILLAPMLLAGLQAEQGPVRGPIATGDYDCDPNWLVTNPECYVQCVQGTYHCPHSGSGPLRIETRLAMLA